MLLDLADAERVVSAGILIRDSGDAGGDGFIVDQGRGLPVLVGLDVLLQFFMSDGGIFAGGELFKSDNLVYFLFGER